MSDFSELIRVGNFDNDETLKFFLRGLGDELGGRSVPWVQHKYVASILADVASTSSTSTESFPSPVSLIPIFDHWASLPEHEQEPRTFEIHGRHTLFLAGFCGEQLKVRHNIKFFISIGQDFYRWAGEASKKVSEQHFFTQMAKAFPDWVETCRSLERTLRDNRYLLKFD